MQVNKYVHNLQNSLKILMVKVPKLGNKSNNEIMKHLFQRIHCCQHPSHELNKRTNKLLFQILKKITLKLFITHFK